ncbi:putative O-methyltransferase [Aspergillus saccharolyticus JOP 1030-1]|uniref:Putative O-methyltransferase n=1 Tax=Aspergillus saccharolyticus JOP 1030-1 TaxID=1450539 RepID=A0A318ZK33_9EURO|nr:putative O-methyltransferase [Aspergillus saccharolyticus JOP 1030-1]PYH47155.1 putative O-methyltransferase [Aspergillus saccharolyticus JOP 1030-1]
MSDFIPRADEAKAALAHLNTIDLDDPETHKDAISHCQATITALQKPGDLALESFTTFTIFPCLRTASDLRIFERPRDGPLTLQQLAEQTGAETSLLARLLRVITGIGVIHESGPETYTATPTSHILGSPAFAAGFRMFGKIGPNLQSFPDYLQATKYRNPSDSDSSSGIFQSCFHTDHSFFSWLAANPSIAHDFNTFQTTKRNRQHWSESYPVWARITEGVDTLHSDRPLLVDVGGSVGHGLRAVKAKFPHPLQTGQLILQDQQSVIETIQADMRDPMIEYIPYDFFTPQMVKGARVYLLKHIIHNWPDDKVVSILRNVTCGMRRGYSKLWLFGGIMPEWQAPRILSRMDIVMMVFMAAMERTERHITELLRRAGLVVTGVDIVMEGYGVIEAMLQVEA